MSSTITIDDEIMRRLEQHARRRGEPVERVVHRALETELDEPEAPLHVPGFQPGVNPDKLLQLADELYDEEFLRQMKCSSSTPTS